MSAGQSLPPPPCMSGRSCRSLTFPRSVLLPHSRQRLYGSVRRSWRISHRWPIGQLQKHRNCDALTPRA
jgi:hypothetical protein